MNKKSTFFNRKTLFSSRSSNNELVPMIYLCRFRQRNRLIEIPSTSEFYHQTNGIAHEHLKQLIIQEFQLQQLITKTPLIIQLWNEHYQEYIDIESFKRIPFEARLQVLVEKDSSTINDSSSKSLSTPVSSHTITTTARSTTPNMDSNSIRTNISDEIYDESISTFDNPSHCQPNLMYDLLPKPLDGIPIPRFPPHIAAFLNGNGDANQLNALVQVLYQEIVKYELYPNADELRSIVSRLVDRYPHCLTVIGSVELLVRKLYYKFCNERKKYPVELKRRQPNKRKRLLRDEDLSMINNPANHLSSLDHLMHLWTNSTATTNEQSSSSSSPNSNHQEDMTTTKFHPLNLSLSTNNNLMCSAD